MSTLEQEINAMRQIATALDPLDATARKRVIRYVLDQIGLGSSVANEESAPADIEVAPIAEASEARVTRDHASRAPDIRAPDIRALVAQKRPKSAIEMATLVAYYLAELAPDKSDTVSVADLEKYFKQGAYPLPKVVRFTLTNAKDAGYLEATGRGQYKLTPVGHNLVAHDMPSDGSPAPSNRARKSSPRSEGKSQRKRRRSGSE